MRMNILLVDDQSSARIMLKRMLKDVSIDLDFLEFESPVQALAWCNDNRPDLIVLDYSMPEMSGLEFTKALRQQTHHNATHILLVSVMMDEDVRLAALESGVDAMLSKPCNPRELQALARRFLEHRQVLLCAQRAGNDGKPSDASLANKNYG